MVDTRVAPTHDQGFTLLELIVATTILLILTIMALPMARVTIKREKEKQLRRALWEMRDAIDLYKATAERGAFQIIRGNNYGSVVGGGVGGLIRKTITAYATLGNGIVDRPSSVTIEVACAPVTAQR